MNRRQLMTLLGLGVFATPYGIKTKPLKTLEILDKDIAGYGHYQSDELVSHMRTGDTLNLRREPKNQYDSRAIEVYWEDKKIGYMPRIHNSALSRLMDQGHSITASITGLDYGHWRPVGLVVKLRVDV